MHEQSQEKAYLDMVTDDLVNDVVLLKDQKDAKAFLESRDETKQRLADKRRQALCLVEKLVGSVRKKGASTRSATAAAKSQKSCLQPKDKSRVYADLEGQPMQMLLRHRPEMAKVVADPMNGRYRLAYPGGLLKSVSWSGRGHSAAVRAALAQLWAWEEAVANRSAPPDVAALLAGETQGVVAVPRVCRCACLDVQVWVPALLSLQCCARLLGGERRGQPRSGTSP